MSTNYDKATDTLTIDFGWGQSDNDSFDYETGNIAVAIDDADSLTRLTIRDATGFIARALAAGVKFEGMEDIELPESEMVWHDADSSMISAFGYNEMTQELDVAFHRTGVYRYYNVSKDVFEGLRDASSQGSYMRGYIIDMYPYEKKGR